MLDQEVLRAIRILVLVDHHMVELLRIELTRRRARVEELDRLEEQVVEVQGIGIFERPQVGVVHAADLLIAQAPAS